MFSLKKLHVPSIIGLELNYQFGVCALSSIESHLKSIIKSIKEYNEPSFIRRFSGKFLTAKIERGYYASIVRFSEFYYEFR